MKFMNPKYHLLLPGVLRSQQKIIDMLKIRATFFFFEELLLKIVGKG